MKSKLSEEEKILYFIMLASVTFVFIYFTKVFNETSKPTEGSLIRTDGKYFDFDSNIESDQNSLNTQLIKAHLFVTNKRYELASKIQNINSYLKYISFIVGTIVILLGIIVIMKGVKETPISSNLTGRDNFQLSLTTSSPGAFISLLGTVIIVISIISKSKLDVDDKPIQISSQNVIKEEISLEHLSETEIEFLEGIPSEVLNIFFKIEKEDQSTFIKFLKNNLESNDEN